MNLYNQSKGLKEIDAYQRGEMNLGLKLGNIELDEHLVYKPGQFNVISGLANVGKTFWLLWYFLGLSLKHGLTWSIYSSENEVWVLKMYLMTFYTGKKVENLSQEETREAFDYISHYFHFIDTQKLYTLDEMIKTFKDGPEVDGYLIDPHNSLSIPRGVNRHDYDYEGAGKIRLFTRETGRTVYLAAHCVTESIRKVHPKNHAFEGYSMPPNEGDIEGGGKWVNRCDDFYVLHRYKGHEIFWNITYVHVKKVRVTQTGGKPTLFNDPLPFRGDEVGNMSFKGFRCTSGLRTPKESQSALNDKIETPGAHISTLPIDTKSKIELTPEAYRELYSD